MTKPENLDPLPGLHEIVRAYLVTNGNHSGYNLDDFDNVVESFEGDERGKEDYLQELYDGLPSKEA